MKQRLITTIFLLFCFTLSAIAESNIKKTNLIEQYKKLNNVLPGEKVSIVDIINSSSLYESLTGNDQSDVTTGMLNKLIEITTILEEKGEVAVTLKLQSEFYPEGTLFDEFEVEKQRQNAIDVLIPIILDKMLDEQQMLDSIQIYDSIPYFTITLNKTNFWKLLESKGIVDIEIVKELSPYLAQSTVLTQAQDAWSSGATGLGQTIAILDSGVRKTHEAFSGGKVVSEACYSGYYSNSTTTCPGAVKSSTSAGSGVNCSNVVSGCDHGTHVAGIAAGNNGVAKEATIIAIQVFSYYGGKISAFDSDIINGLQRVYDLRNTYDIASVNMSLGGGRYYDYCNTTNSAMKAIIDNLLSVNIATVIASGNDGYKNSIAYPACIETAVTVGATTDTGINFSNGYQEIDEVTYYSNSDTTVDLLAPGSTIYAPISTSNTAYASKHGTSMAAPHVAGAFALLKSAKDTLTVAEGLNALQTTGKSITDTNGVIKKRININDALSQLGTGSVTVNLTPSTAQWKIDGGSWQNSGSTITGIFLGTHKITFSSLIHADITKMYLTPNSQTIIFTFDGESQTVSVTYQEKNKPKYISNDLNGDKKSDILLRNTDGNFYLYPMDGNVMSDSHGFVKTSSGVIAKPSYTQWKTAGIGDFNADGKSDILLRRTDGSFYLYPMDGNVMSDSHGFVKTSSGVIAKPSYTQWKTQ